MMKYSSPGNTAWQCIPNMKNSEQEYLQQLPVTYDLKYSEKSGHSKQCISISEKKKVGEPLYQVVINTVRVMPEKQFPSLIRRSYTRIGDKNMDNKDSQED